MSITNHDSETCIQKGSQLRLGYLIEQGGYTLGIAARDEAEITPLLPSGYLSRMREALGELMRALEDRQLVRDEARFATERQNNVLRQVKVWRRQVAKLSLAVTRMGEKLPQELLIYSSASTVPAMIEQLTAMNRRLEENRGKYFSSNLDQLIARGRSIIEELKSADSTQEVARLRDAPEAVRKLYEQKGRFYFGLKLINDVGRALHADDPAAASVYHLSILHRRASNREKSASEKQ